MLAINVYMAMCYHKMDYYDVSQEVLSSYIQAHPTSVMAANLKSCNYYRLYNGKAAEAELRILLDAIPPSFDFGRDILRHNLAIFRGGEGALQTLPSLIGVLPEARFNLAIYHLKHGELQHVTAYLLHYVKYCSTDNMDEGYALIKDLAPNTAQEYILKAVALTMVGQEHNSVRDI